MNDLTALSDYELDMAHSAALLAWCECFGDSSIAHHLRYMGETEPRKAEYDRHEAERVRREVAA